MRRMAMRVAVVAAWLLALAAYAADTQGAAEQRAVDTVRERLVALHPPWYDVERDDWRRVDLPQPFAPHHLDWLNLPHVPATPIAWVLIGLIVVGLVWLVVMVIRSGLLTAAPARAPAVAGSPGVIASLPIGLPSDQDPQVGLARALAARDWTRAVMWLYALTLLRLDRAAVIRLASGTTNRSYLGQAASDALAAAALRTTVTAFERSWFGGEAIDEATVRACQDALRSVERAST